MLNPDTLSQPFPEAETMAGMLARSRMFLDFQAAFESATGLPMSLYEAGGSPDGLSSRPAANLFCLLLATSNPACAACFALQQD